MYRSALLAVWSGMENPFNQDPFLNPLMIDLLFRFFQKCREEIRKKAGLKRFFAVRFEKTLSLTLENALLHTFAQCSGAGAGVKVRLRLHLR